MTTAMLPVVATATLPVSYERAKEALARCHAIDECKDWADKAAALASYAKQADDDTLQKFALRIQSRAIRRCGELLQTFQTGPQGGRPKGNGGDAPPVSQRLAAEAAGMSKDQEKQAVRVANVPDDEFELAIESDDPPTITRLAELGTKSQPKAVPPKFAEATHVLGVFHTFAKFCAGHQAGEIASALYPHERESSRGHVVTIETWLAEFMRALEEGAC